MSSAMTIGMALALFWGFLCGLWAGYWVGRHRAIPKQPRHLGFLEEGLAAEEALAQTRTRTGNVTVIRKEKTAATVEKSKEEDKARQGG